MEPTTLTLIITTCVGALGTVLVYFKKTFKNIKCCFGSGIEFKESQNQQNTITPTNVSPQKCFNNCGHNCNCNMWENIQPYTRNNSIRVTQI